MSHKKAKKTDDVQPAQKLGRKEYEKELAVLQAELVKAAGVGGRSADCLPTSEACCCTRS